MILTIKMKLMIIFFLSLYYPNEMYDMNDMCLS